MNWLPRLTLLCVLCTGAGCEASSQTLAGYLFSAFQSADNLTISAAAVSPSGNTTTYTDVVFPSVQLPSQTCGDRNGRCDVSVFTIDGSTRVAVLVAVGNGTVVALFDRLNSGLIFIDQHFFFLPGITCSLTTFVQDDIFLYGLCYEFTNNDGVVLLDVYRTVLNFDQLKLARFDLYIAPGSTNYDFYISRGFLSSCTGFTNVYWFGNAFFYYLRVDISDSSINDQDISVSDPAIEQCFDNGTHQVVIFDDSSLLAYCNNNITVEVDFCQRSEPVVTRTRFYCSGSRDTYLEVSDNLTVNSSVDYAIPFPLDSSVPYVGDCVEIRGLLFFVGSSTNGFAVLTNVLGNLTTILATDAQVNHQVIDNRFILYSNSTSSALLDLSCPDPSTPIHVSNVSFELSAFFPNSEFSCFTDQPTQPPSTTVTVSTDTTDFTEAKTESSAIQTLSGGIIVGIVFGTLLFGIGIVVVAILGYRQGRKKFPITANPQQASTPLIEHQLKPPTTVEQNISATQEPTKELYTEPSIDTPPLTEPTPGPPTVTEPTGPQPQLGATPNTFIPNRIPKLDLHVAGSAQEERGEIDSSAYLANPHVQGTELNPVEDDIQRQNSITSVESSVTVVAAEPAQRDGNDDAEIVANGIPLVATMRTSTSRVSRAITASQADPNINDYSRAAECCAVSVSQTGHLDTEHHWTEPGIELPLKSKFFHFDQLQGAIDSRLPLETAPTRASTDSQCSNPPLSVPTNLIHTDHSDPQEPDNERIN